MSLDDENVLAMRMPTPHDAGEIVSVIAQVVGLVKTLHDWWTADKSAAHVGASLKALELLIETRPTLRAQLIEQVRQDPSTASQLRALATDEHPALMAIAKEL